MLDESSRVKSITQYDRLSQQQLGFLLSAETESATCPKSVSRVQSVVNGSSLINGASATGPTDRHMRVIARWRRSSAEIYM